MLQHRAWAFHALFLARATTRSHQPRAWADQAHRARVVRVAQVHLPAVPVVQVVQVAQAAPRVPVAQRVRVVLAHVQVSEAHVRAAPQVALQAEPRVVSLAQVVAQQAVAVAALAAVPQVLSVRAVPVARARHVNQSARNAKNSNSAAMRHLLVARLSLVATAQPSSVFVAVQPFKTLPTRLRPHRVS